MRDASVFFFLAAASIAFFSFLVAHHWIDARTAERRARERFALLRRLADQPSDNVQRVIDLMREDDAREARREEQKQEEARREELKAGVILVATGVALAIFLGNLMPTRALWAVGLIPAFVGVVVGAFAYFKKGPRAD
jgi:Flp pilus assembly protein TadB